MREPLPRDAAVVGLGLVTPLGFGVEAVVAALAAERRVAASAARVEEPWLRDGVPADLEGQVKFLNGSGQMAITAAAEAVAEARLDAAGFSGPAKGLFLAQWDAHSAELAHYRPAFADATDGYRVAPQPEALNAATMRRTSPFFLLETILNNAFSFLSARHGLEGPNVSLSGWAATGLEATALAADAVRRGDTSAAVVVAAGRFTCGAIRFEAERRKALAPGTVPSEGAAALVLEPLHGARARGTPPLAVVLGDGTAFGPAEDGRGPSPDAVAAALAEAAERSGWVRGEPVVVAAREPRLATEALRLAGLDGAASIVAWGDRLGHAGPASEVTDAVLGCRALAGNGVGPRSARASAVLVLATGLDGQARAVLLARP